MDQLLEGYRRFRNERLPELRDLYQKLATGQQNPKCLVIGCCDSRVDPATIFRAGPGEIFVLRNVANLVPPFNQGAGLHGSGAAIEFACRMLRVKTILVLGHAQCGGIAAAIDRRIGEGTDFLGPWVDLIKPALARCPANAPDLHAAVERESVRVSLERLAEYPFVRDAIEAGELEIRGALFGVATGTLELLDGRTGEFHVVS
mgnify:CR=1 FL=1